MNLAKKVNVQKKGLKRKPKKEKKQKQNCCQWLSYVNCKNNNKGEKE